MIKDSIYYLELWYQILYDNMGHTLDHIILVYDLRVKGQTMIIVDTIAP